MYLHGVAAVVLNWNRKEDTLVCLRSLQEQRGVEVKIIVVDNGSVDDSADAVRDRFPSATVIETGVNLGYAGGNNVGMSYVMNQGIEYVLVVNNDTLLEPRCAARLLAGMEPYPDVAAAAPKSLYFDAPGIIYFAGGRIAADGAVIHVGIGRHDAPAFRLSADTEWLTGCAVMFRSSVLQEIGLFEPKYYLLYEDADWSLRARNAGYRLRFVPEARLRHKVAASFGKVWSPAYLYYYTRNSCLWIERNFPTRRKPRLYYHGIKRAFRIARHEAIDACAEGENPLQNAVWRGLFDYLLRRFGQRTYVW